MKAVLHGENTYKNYNSPLVAGHSDSSEKLLDYLLKEAKSQASGEKEDLKQDVLEELSQWGLYAKERYLPGWYSSQPYYTQPDKYKEDATPSDLLGNILTMTEQEFQHIDKVIAATAHLNTKNPIVARLRFIAQMSIRAIATRMNWSKQGVTDSLNEVVTWVAATQSDNDCA